MDDKTLSYSYSGDPTNILKRALEMEAEEAIKDKMIINLDKCHAITFNFSKKNTAPSNLSIDGHLIQSCDKINLLGVIISQDLKWSENTQHICDKVNRKIYILGKLKKFGLRTEELLTVWKTVLRPLTEYATPLWHSGLTDVDSDMLESLQKRSLGIILGVTYVNNKRRYKFDGKTLSYEQTLEKTNLDLLKDRREFLTKKFALQAVDDARHNEMFQPKIHNVNTRLKSKYQEYFCETNRLKMSAVPYITRMLNNNT